eukprot:CAMPEP_0117753386 /NCGR_PEP_ID=MMETSP0947-20121206/12189_1 /TAXON_ID=44440 /ORGANISM="Chattonella subsalsa, Strain CCMP2191" /LENGTH=146 /DNA_ID=CAMNT_0005572247 /DNA_START=281 /DNA_END=721 /DNA_ORIENTATION=+
MWDDSSFEGDDFEEMGNMHRGISAEKLMRLGSFKWKETKRSSLSLKTQLGPECCICLNEYTGNQDLTKLPCQHIFHNKCIFKWLSTSPNCPLCANDIENLIDDYENKKLEKKEETFDSSQRMVMVHATAPASVLIDADENKDGDIV